MPPHSKPIRWLVLFAGLSLFSAAYLHLGSLLISQRNNTVEDILGGDQKHNIKLAVLSRSDLLPHRTDGVVNPLWPWIASRLVADTHQISAPDEVSPDDRALFDRGRRLSLGITMAFLCLLGVYLAATGFSLPATFNILLLGGLGALLPRCAYFQPEPLYYTLLFLSWVCALALIKRARLPLYLALGCLLGLAYLAKSSIQPLLAAFFAVSAYQIVRDFLSKDPAAPKRSLLRPAGLALVILAFFLTASPRLIQSKAQFGSMSHSYPGYWMWMDHFESAYQWMGEHGDASTLTSIPPEEKPSFSNYWRTHSGPAMWHRLTDGFWLKTSEFFAPKTTRRDKQPPRPWEGILEFRGLYLLGLTLLLAATALAAKRAPTASDSPASHPESGPLLIFVLGTFALSALAYGWYSPIGRGDRFMLSLYLPLAFSLIAAADHLYRHSLTRARNPWLPRAYLAAQLTISALLIWRVAEILSAPHFTP